MSTALERIKQVLSGIQLATFTTVAADGSPRSRYVMIRVDEDMTLRFATHLATAKIEQIKSNPKVHLLCGVTSLETARHWVEVEGEAEIRTDEPSRQAIWFDPLSKYFSGPEDPNLAVIAVRPTSITYHSMEEDSPLVWKP